MVWSTAASTANSGAGRRNPLTGEGAIRLSSYSEDELFGTTRPDDTGRHLQIGQYIHELTDRHNKAVMAGCTLRIDDVLDQTPLPLQLRDGGEGDLYVRGLGREFLEEYRGFLEGQHFAAIVASERYVCTPPRPVAGVPGCAIVLSGRFDLIATRVVASHDEIESNTLRSVTCIDVKTSISADLADQPSSAIYDHLARFAYQTDDVELMQVTRTGQWTSVRLTPTQIEVGKDFCRPWWRPYTHGSFRPVLAGNATIARWYPPLAPCIDQNRAGTPRSNV